VTDEELIAAAKEFVRDFDEKAEVFLDLMRGNPELDRLFYSASTLGDHSLIWHILGGLEGILPGGSAIDAARFAVIMGAESALVNGPIKAIFRRERPTAPDERPHALRQPLTSSFPSGHASAAMVAAAVLSYRRPLLTPLFYGIGGVVATSRAYVRIHHASDVAGGLVVGAVLGRIAVIGLRIVERRI
jgi:membrane-associated phospholipid phosphatase